MAEYVIEYKSAEYPYNYKFAKHAGTGEVARFSSINDARKASISLIRRGSAILCAVRGKGVEQLVYRINLDMCRIESYGLRVQFVMENRKTNTWYVLNDDGSLRDNLSDTTDPIWVTIFVGQGNTSQMIRVG